MLYPNATFEKGAKIVLSNESGMDLSLLFFDIDFVSLEKPGRVYCIFMQCGAGKMPGLGKDVELLPEVKGRGRFLGISAAVNVNPAYGHTWWGEGEVKMYIDGDKEKITTINGTGSEDYIGTGWFEGTFTHQYQGCLLADAKNRQYAFYRFHIPDALIWFYKDFHATIQQIGGW